MPNFSAHFSAGIHPWFLEERSAEEKLQQLETLLREDKLAAIGETGLDRMCDTPFKLQEEYFIRQLELAEKFEKPVIIHNVRSGADLLRIRKAGGFSQPWILHRYGGSEEETEQFIKMNCYFSFGEQIMTEGSKACSCLANTNQTRILLETDDSEIAVSSLYERAANLMETETERLKRIINQNFDNIFNFK